MRSVVDVVHPFRTLCTQATKVGFVTDVEGNMKYFKRFVSQSSVVSFKEGRLHLEEGATFVYGGDACDKAPGDLAFLELLVDLKEQHPQRVHFILGNRDINKMRLTSELADSEFAHLGGRPAEDAWAPHWVRPAKGNTLPMYIRDLAERTKQAPVVVDTKQTRLRWLFDKTMGCNGTMELRKQELARRMSRPPADVSDEDVLLSYMDSVSPGGLMHRYLSMGQLALVLGDTLFVHGGLHANNIGHVPGVVDMEEDVHRWVHLLNNWARQEVDAWTLQPRWNARRTRGGAQLIKYGGPGDQTVVCSTWLVDGNPAEIPRVVSEYLKRGGISRVVSGHKPHGDSPTPIRSNGIEVLTADTSYSDPGADDNRGLAASSVDLQGGEHALDVCVQGVLSCGTAFNYSMAGDPYLGRRVADGYWVKVPLEHNGKKIYTAAKGNGFKVSTRRLTMKEMRRELAAVCRDDV